MIMNKKTNKEKVLFVMPTIACGGAEKALVELLKAMDKDIYDIDLILFRKDDLFYLNDIPKEINIIENSELMKMCFDHVKRLFKNKLFLKNIDLFFLRIYLTFRMKVNNFFRKKNYFYQWNKLSKYVPNLDTEYSVAIGYLEGDTNFFIVDKVNSKKKIGWMHTDYVMGGFSREHDFKYFEKLDSLICVSKLNAKNLVQVFPEFEDKIDVMYNLLNIEEFYSKSNENIDWDNGYKGIKIISVGNLRYVKGYDIAIKACHKLVENGYDIKWYVAGEGKERTKLESLIKKYSLKKNFILLGLCSNPYFYIKNADIFVQSSRHEGFSTTVTEAKIFAKPIIVTDCPGMSDQIISKKNGTIVPINEESIYLAIKELIDHPKIQKLYEKNLLSEKIVSSKEEQLNHFYEIIRFTNKIDY